MPKVKTNSGAKKRFKMTGTGKIKRKRGLVGFTVVDDTNMDRIRLMLKF